MQTMHKRSLTELPRQHGDALLSEPQAGTVPGLLKEVLGLGPFRV